MPPQPRDPYELKLSDEQRTTLALFLCDEVRVGLDARASAEQDVDYWHQLYEQARTRTKNVPWPDAADLTSYLPVEKVDALHARLMQTIFGVEPIWTVEGWGRAADRAPFVEEFHQWKAEEERFQSICDRWAQIALIEPRGLLEVSEGSELRTTRKRVLAKLQTDPITNGFIYDEDGSPMPEEGPDGNIVEAGPTDIAAETVIDETARVRTGPCYRILPYRDSLILPGHARDKEDVWGYFKRFWKRYDAIVRQADGGLYDEEAVSKITATGDREPDPALQRAKQDIAPQDSATTSEKELWEGVILLDLDALFQARHVGKVRDTAARKGARWYLVTLHLPSQQMLRVQFDDVERSRFVPLILFPRPDRVTEGFSLVGHKLLTIAEEHTAVRNMKADRSAMAVNAPIKRLTGALWDPVEQPFGPKAVIDVRDMRELEAMQIPDVTQPLVEWEQNIERTAERVVGVNDISSGQVLQQTKTLGEVQMATAAAEVRMNLIVRRFQEALEEVGQIRHAIWQRTLAEQPDGIDAPQSLLTHLEGRGVAIDQYLPEQKITAQLLEGPFRFKPYGSLETANPHKRRQDFVMAMQALPALLGAFPTLQMQIQSPTAARAMFREFLRVFQIENEQAFLGSPAQDLQQTAMANVLQQMVGGGPPMGLPMGGASPPMMGGPGLMPPPPPAMPLAPSTNTVQ